MSISPAWQFPPSNGGIDYANDPSSAYFSDAPIQKLVREIIQNSLDAKESGLETPVKVKFSEKMIGRELIGASDLRKHLTSCSNRAQASKWHKLQKVYDTALKTLRGKQIRCLQIVDSGTTGLKGDHWAGLVYREGAVEKSGGAPGGNYGIGKNAVSNVSDLQTVFYSTRYLNGRKGRVEKLQGKATLMTHPNPRKKSQSLQHIGFYKDSEGNPILGRDIPNFFRLDEPGTGVFVMGFNPRSNKWVDEITSAVIENFFYAIHHKRLVVEIETRDGKAITVTYEDLESLFNQDGKTPNAYYYYKAIRDIEAVQTPDINKIGELDIHVTIGSGPRRIAYINRNGMLITDSREQKINPIAPRGRSLWPDFAGVVVPVSDEGDNWIRTMENPSHDSMSPLQLQERRDQIQAEKIFKQARDSTREIIDNISETARYGDTSNLDELASALPEFDSDAPGNKELETQTIQPPRAGGTQGPSIEIREEDGVYRTDEDGNGEGGANGNGGEGDDEGHTNGGGEGDGGGEGQHNGEGGEDGNDGESNGEDGNNGSGRTRERGARRANLNNVRIMTVAQRQAVIAFTAAGDSQNQVSLSLIPAGEERGRENRIEITQASLENYETPVSVSDGRIALTPRANERTILRVNTINDIESMAFTLGVSS